MFLLLTFTSSFLIGEFGGLVNIYRFTTTLHGNLSIIGSYTNAQFPMTKVVAIIKHCRNREMTANGPMRPTAQTVSGYWQSNATDAG